jgi:nicotinamidase-related amidase
MPNTTTALLIIDIQKELFQKKNPVYQADEMLTNVCRLAEQAHLAGVPVIYIQHDNNTMPQGTDGWQLHPRLQPIDGDLFFQKQHSSAFEKSKLHETLAGLGVHDLVITGLVTHGCVKAACLDALKLGYQVTLVSDGQSNFNPKPAQVIAETVETLRNAGVTLKPTSEIVFQS